MDKVILPGSLNTHFEFTFIKQFRAVNQNFSSSPDVCLVSKDGHSLYTQRWIIFSLCAILLFWNALKSKIETFSQCCSDSTLTLGLLPPLHHQRVHLIHPVPPLFIFRWVPSFPNIQAASLNAPQPSYLCFVSYPTGWQHHLKGDYKNINLVKVQLDFMHFISVVISNYILS